MSSVYRSRELAVIAAQIAVLYKMPLANAEEIVRNVAMVALRFEFDEIELMASPASEMLLAPYRRPDGTIVIE